MPRTLANPTGEHGLIKIKRPQRVFFTPFGTLSVVRTVEPSGKIYYSIFSGYQIKTGYAGTIIL